MLSTQNTYKTGPTELFGKPDACGLVPASAPAPARNTNWYSDFTLAGILGRELAEPLLAMQSVLQAVERSKLLTGDDVRRLNDGINSARTLSIQSQQIARMAGGELRQSHEKLKLDAMVLSCMQERSSEFRKQGVEVFQRLRPVEVIVDAGLLYSLLEAALDWAVEQGRKLTVTLEIKNWPVHGLLIFKASHVIADKSSDETNDRRKDVAGDKPSDDTVNWYLVNEISHAMGLSVTRIKSQQDTSLLIEFSRTVNRLEGLTAIEIDTGLESQYGESRPIAGAHILLITDDARLQMEVRAICKRSRLVLDCVTNADLAARFCRLESPALIVIDQNMWDPVFNELHAELRKTDPVFPFIEIAAAANILEIAGWTSESMSRLSKDALKTHLVDFITMDLAKVM